MEGKEGDGGDTAMMNLFLNDLPMHAIRAEYSTYK